MTYNPDIPQNLPPGRDIVDQIRTNFSQYASIFANNHSPLNNTTQGKHTNVLLQRQASDPDIDGDFDSLYGKSVTSASGTSDQVFLRIPQFLPNEQLNEPMQLTFNSVNTAGPNQYQSFLAGGYLIYLGKTSNILIPIVLVPAPSIILTAIANPTNFLGSTPFDVSVTINSASQFTLNSLIATGVYEYTWVAIGKQ